MRERIVKIVLVTAVFLSSAAPATAREAPRAAVLPGIGAIDGRHPVSLDDAPFRALARVQTELGARCTGFLIAPALVMTAAHCLFLPEVGGFLRPSSVHVLLGYRAGLYRAHRRAVAFRIAPGYRPGAEGATAGADRAILVLDRPAGLVTDALPLLPAPATPRPVRLAGYGQDRDELAVESPPCAVIGLPRDGGGRVLLAHDCEATSGTSGAPLVVRRADGGWAAVGVQIEARVAGAGGLASPVLDGP